MTQETVTVESGTFNPATAAEVFNTGQELGELGGSASVELLAPIIGLGEVAGDPTFFAGSVLAAEVAGFIGGGQATVQIQGPYSQGTFNLANYGGTGTVTYDGPDGRVEATSQVSLNILQGAAITTTWADGTIVQQENPGIFGGPTEMSITNPDGSVEVADAQGNFWEYYGPGGQPLPPSNGDFDPAYEVPVYYYDLDGNPTDASGNLLPGYNSTTDGLETSQYNLISNFNVNLGGITTADIDTSGVNVTVYCYETDEEYIPPGVDPDEVYSDDVGYALSWNSVIEPDQDLPTPPHLNWEQLLSEDQSVPLIWMFSLNQG